MTKTSKKLISILAIIPLLTGCKTNTYELNAFFDNNILENRDMVGLPRTPGNLLYYRNLFGHEVYSNGVSEETYNEYIQNVFSYLVGREYKYFGRITRAGSGLDRLYDYYYHPATELEDFYRSGSYFFFFTNKDPNEPVSSETSRGKATERLFPGSFALEVGLKDTTVRYSEDQNASEEDKKEFKVDFEIRIHGMYNVYLIE